MKKIKLIVLIAILSCSFLGVRALLESRTLNMNFVVWRCYDRPFSNAVPLSLKPGGSCIMDIIADTQIEIKDLKVVVKITLRDITMDIPLPITDHNVFFVNGDVPIPANSRFHIMFPLDIPAYEFDGSTLEGKITIILVDKKSDVEIARGKADIVLDKRLDK